MRVKWEGVTGYGRQVGVGLQESFTFVPQRQAYGNNVIKQGDCYQGRKNTSEHAGFLNNFKNNNKKKLNMADCKKDEYQPLIVEH